ncbi:cobyrinate a,c-diamide synthase [Inmirania thermothiophila]|uniref:Cobyrinate a,c-diamide synthase n=1 Tax=Inmirania thermothiophila TaxID=1750597 RepID=A0A3N1XZY6_9GAMM|nr:cobyrinate a,c-diamide synthase [Inmirania thermothiophila]ROR32165.1 hydrogenobyrinic acid a,c-diamide synthase (glutamine-hydrolysing) /cobyrinate a,c-diamide synthase [Inmirania thermothiophila]
MPEPTRLVYLSAAHKSSGKTVVAVGLVRALRRRGLSVQPLKKGPDYIDPMWLGRAAGRPCRNLDFHTQAPDEIRTAAGTDADVALVEGTKGLHDGVAADGADSNAALARLLGAPVVLVLDTRGMTRGVAPLVQGLAGFEPDVPVAGVILNRVAGARHEAKLRRALETYTAVPVLGAVAEDPRLRIPERHLGLVPAEEHGAAEDAVQRMADAVERGVDLEALLAAAAPVPRRAPPPRPLPSCSAVRIGVARDAAFGFYYPDDLEALERAGARIVPFSPLRDARLPEVDALFIGGGFPETHLEALAANAPLRHEIRTAILERGLPAYAECGGLMYLARAIAWRGTRAPMCGVIPATARMHGRPVGRGYGRLRETAAAPWPRLGDGPGEIPVHEFHYSALVDLPPATLCAYEVVRGTGIGGGRDGIVVRNLLACYAHQRHTRANPWVQRFLAFVRARAAAASRRSAP